MPAFAVWQMEPKEFLQGMDRFHQAADAAVEQQSDTTNKSLKHGDIAAYTRLMISQYIDNYGLDSIRNQHYIDLFRNQDKGETIADSLFETASREQYVKHLTDADKKALDSLVTTGWDIRDSALFRYSGSYRRLVDNRLSNIFQNEYASQISAERDERMVRQDMVDKILGPGYVHECYSYENADFLMNMETDTAVVGKFVNRYLAIAHNTYFKDKVIEGFKNFKACAKGAVAPVFTYRDVNGKSVSLNKLRGKYVYIDVWATWCGPCKMEIPHLSALEKSYEGKNIHFVSLSVDKQKDKGAWMKYVKDHKLQGIQVMADKDFRSDFVQKFNITYIPRFLLIDPDGKILESNAARPSQKELKIQLDKLLSVNTPK
jgi:thiol-disulfide isomerase/thioredoxin